jgi:protein O-mannosyl-transferase
MLNNYFQKETIRKHLDLLICLFLALLTALIYWQVKNFDFVSYDDLAFIPNNPHVRTGLTLRGIQWAFTTFYEGYWHPLTWLSHMAAVELFGLKPGGHHLINVVIHIATTVLLFLVLKKMTRAIWQSAFVAALFALHPLHVESVAWVAERKDVLSAFFWILTLGAYALYAEKPNAQRYLLTLLFFILGLMSKPMIVTLPFTLLLLDYWPLGRLQQINLLIHKPQKEIAPESKQRKRKSSGSILRQIHDSGLPIVDKPVSRRSLLFIFVIEKIPFFILSVLFSFTTFVAVKKVGALSSLKGIPLSGRMINAAVSYVMYLVKMFWPFDLALFYPHPLTYPLWQSIGAAFLLIAFTIFAMGAYRRFPYFTMGWFWYLITLIPVSGLVQAGMQARADRYTYVPLIGLFVTLAWGVPEMTKKWPHRGKVLPLFAVMLIIPLMILSWYQIQYWKDDFTVFQHAINVTKDNDLAHSNLGFAYHNKGDLNNAMKHYRLAIIINPDHPDTHYNLGISLADQGHFQEAMDQCGMAVRLDPKHAPAYYNLAYVLMLQGRNDEAVKQLQVAIRLDPEYAKAYGLLGDIFAAEGKNQEAADYYNQALEIEPIMANIHYNLGTIQAKLGQMDEAVRHFRKAVELKPDYAKAHNNLGMAMLIQGQIDDAILHFQEALRADPKNDLARKNLQDALARKKQRLQ